MGLLVTALVLQACSDRAARPTTATSAPSVAILDVRGIHLLSEKYVPTPDESLLINRAKTVLAERCLAAMGLSATLTQPEPDRFGPPSLLDRRYGITDRALARTSAYGLGVRDPAEEKRAPQPTLSIYQQIALSGNGPTELSGHPVAAGGCWGRADRVIGKGAPVGADPRLGDKLQFATFEQSKSDPRVERAVAAWAACMRAHRLAYSDPLLAMADPRVVDGQVTSYSLTLAATDLLCKEKVNLVGRWYAVEQALQVQERRRNPGTFRDARTALRTELSNARAALAAPAE